MASRKSRRTKVNQGQGDDGVFKVPEVPKSKTKIEDQGPDPIMSKNPLVIKMSKILKNIEEKFRCQICLDFLKRPARLRCHHKFCRMCIEQHIRVGQQIRVSNENDSGEFKPSSCPLCADENVTKRSLTDDTENSPLQRGLFDLMRQLENGLNVDFEEIREPPNNSNREAPSPKPLKSKLDINGTEEPATTRSRVKSTSKKEDVAANTGRKRKIDDHFDFGTNGTAKKGTNNRIVLMVRRTVIFTMNTFDLIVHLHM